MPRARVPDGRQGVAVELSRVSLRLAGRWALRRVELSLAAGSATVVVGANGAGKSQLLKILAGIRWPEPSAGARRRYALATGEPMELRDLRPRLQLVSGEQQDRYERYGWSFSVTTIVGTGCRGLDAPLGALRAAERALARSCLALLGLERLGRRRLLSLSYGERRLVLIARALAARPRLLLLDEVYNGLDEVHRRRLDRVLERLCRSGPTLALTAHRAEDAPASFARAIVLDRGRLRYDGPRDRLPEPWAGQLGANPPSADGPSRARPAQRATHDPMALVSLRGASVYREGRRVLDALDWSLAPGTHWAVVGSNGSGKTTLLDALYGRLPVAEGGLIERRGHAAGQPIEAWQARVGYLGPDGHTECLGAASLLELTLTGIPALRRLGARAAPREVAAARRALRLVGMLRLAAAPPRSVSYGQLRLALLARALISGPELLLLDEPLTGLDAPTRARMRELLQSVAGSGTQLVAAVHHADDLVPSVTHTLHLPSGRVVARPPAGGVPSASSRRTKR